MELLSSSIRESVGDRDGALGEAEGAALEPGHGAVVPTARSDHGDQADNATGGPRSSALLPTSLEELA